uniref:EF-hand domain-containing protein n=1 Tax=Cryptomonas curvata TaxID=233186 RepID=A0A7S0M3T5_9CRYP
MSYELLLNLLHREYGRPVAFIYESQGLCTVDDESSFRTCINHVRSNFEKKEVSTASRLEAYILNLDQIPRKSRTLKVGNRDTRDKGAPSILGHNLRRQTDGDASFDWSSSERIGAQQHQISKNLSGLRDVTRSASSIPVHKPRVFVPGQTARTSWDFESRFRQIDALMGQPQGSVEAKGNSPEKKAAQRSTKAAGVQMERANCDLQAVNAAEAQILTAIRDIFVSIPQAFKRMDADGDGQISEREFVEGIGRMLKLTMPIMHARAVFGRINLNSTEKLSYHKFIDWCQTNPDTQNVNTKELSNEELLAILSQKQKNIFLAFEAMDINRDSRLSLNEMQQGLMKIGLRLSSGQIQKLFSFLDGNSNGSVDYREFMQQLSRSSRIAERNPRAQTWAKERDSMQEVLVRDAVRSRFQDAQQAFHAFDSDQDGRLSLDEFKAGISSLFKGDHAEAPSSSNIARLFQLVDSDGDGYLGYHEFLAAYGVPVELREASAVDSKIRDVLKTRFAGSAREAFESLDLDRDGKLSQQDLEEGLKKIGLELTTMQAGALIKRGDYDNDKAIDFYEFLVRFGLEQQVPGKWVFQKEEPVVQPAVEAAEVKLWRTLLPASKWFGRGGIRATLARYAPDNKGFLSRDEFLRAAREGLGMKTLANSDIDILLGPKVCKAWCTGGKVDVIKFSDLFLNANFKAELSFYAFLQRDQHWKELLKALKSFDTGGAQATSGDLHNSSMSAPNDQRVSGGIDQSDMESALQRLLALNLVTQETKKDIMVKMDADGVWNGGKFCSPSDLLHRYVGSDMDLHDIVAPSWEVCADSFGAVLSGSENSLDYNEFRQICRTLPVRPSLSFSQIEELIDNIDMEGTGRIFVSKFLQRFAGDEDLLCLAVRKQWAKVLSLLRAKSPAGSNSHTLPIPVFTRVLHEAQEEGILTSITENQIRSATSSLPRDLFVGTELLFEEWVHRQAGDIYKVHKAFLGNDSKSGYVFPIWDTVISALEISSSNQQQSQRKFVTRSCFCCALSRAGIRLPRSALLNLLDFLDPTFCDEIDWVKFVQGNCPPYFFNGKMYLYARRFFQTNWRIILTSCKDMEATSKKPNSGSLGFADFTAVVHQTLLTYEVLDASDKEIIWPILVDLFTAFQGGKGSGSVAYEKFVVHFAGESAMAESLLHKKWESIWTELGGRWDEVDSKELEKVLENPKIGFSQAMCSWLLSMLFGEMGLQQEEGSIYGQPLKIEEICWYAAKAAIAAKLMEEEATQGRRNIALLRSCRVSDLLLCGLISGPKFVCLLRTIGGMTPLQAELLLRRMKGEQGLYPYQEFLEGNLKLEGLAYDGRMCRGWTCLERNWERIVSHFQRYDTDFDCKVSAHEFAQGLCSLNCPDLLNMETNLVLSTLFIDKDGQIALEQFVWAVAKPTFQKLLSPISVELNAAFEEFMSLPLNCSKGRASASREEASKVLSKVMKQGCTNDLHISMILDKAEPVKGSGISLVNLQDAIKWVLEAHVTLEDSAKLLSAASEVLPVMLESLEDRWAEALSNSSVGLSRSRSNLGGVSLLGPKALKCVDGISLRREFMLPLADSSENCLLGTCAVLHGSETIEALCKWRLENVYSSAAWSTFWNQHSAMVEPRDICSSVSESDLVAAIDHSISRSHEIEEAFAMLDVDSTGTIPLAHAVGILSSVPGCNAWPSTGVIHKMLSPFLVDPANERNRGDSLAHHSAALHSELESDLLLDYRGFLRAHGAACASLVGLAESRHNSGVYTQLALLRS